MTSIKVGLNGAKGKMGRVVTQALKTEKGMELLFGSDKGDDLAALVTTTGADVVVDFTEPGVVFTNTMAIIESGARPVVGTTGLTEENLAAIRAALEEKGLGGIVAPNFSLGALLMMKFAAAAADFFGNCEIVEMHHAEKVDSPSGTAALTAETIAAAQAGRREPARRGNPVPTEPAGRPAEENPSRGVLHKGVRIHSIRLPGLVAHQQILFGGPGETLTIRHDALSRDCFIPGILRAIRRVREISGLEIGLRL